MVDKEVLRRHDGDEQEAADLYTYLMRNFYFGLVDWEQLADHVHVYAHSSDAMAAVPPYHPSVARCVTEVLSGRPALINHMKAWPSLPWGETRAWEQFCRANPAAQGLVVSCPALPWRWDVLSAAAWLTPQFVLSHSHQPWSWNCWSMLDMVLQLPLGLVHQHVTDAAILALVNQHHISRREAALMVPWSHMQRMYVWYWCTFQYDPDACTGVMHRWCRLPTVDLAFVCSACLSDVRHTVKWDMQALVDTKAWRLPMMMAVKRHYRDRLDRFVSRWLLHVWRARAAQRRQHRRCDQVRQELMAAAWHPRRMVAWCLDDTEKQDIGASGP